MKKLLALFLALILVLSLCACGNDNSKQDKDDDEIKPPSGTTAPASPQDPADPQEPEDYRVALDVFSGLSVKFNGSINGFGKSFKLEFDYSKVDYDKTNTDIKQFLKDIEFFTDEYSNLSNGDKIVVHASWSKATAEALGVKLLEESKEYTVTGMYDVYRSAADVPATLKEIGDIEEALVDSVDWFHDQNDWYDGYDLSYRYYYGYENDAAGVPYISRIYITAVATFYTDSGSDEPWNVTFLGYNYLYQEYWEMNMRAYAEQSDRVSETGELTQIEHIVKLEEFFPN